MKIDFKDLEHRISTDHNARLTKARTLAPIARIHELEAALYRYGDCEHDEEVTKILEKAAVLR